MATLTRAQVAALASNLKACRPTDMRTKAYRGWYAVVATVRNDIRTLGGLRDFDETLDLTYLPHPLKDRRAA